MLLTKFENEVFNGVSVSGQVESAAAYHAQMSWQKFHWENVGVVGPVRLSADWNTVNPVWDTDRKLWRGRLEFSKAGMSEVISINRARAESGDPPLSTSPMSTRSSSSSAHSTDRPASRVAASGRGLPDPEGCAAITTSTATRTHRTGSSRAS